MKERNRERLENEREREYEKERNLVIPATRMTRDRESEERERERGRKRRDADRYDDKFKAKDTIHCSVTAREVCNFLKCFFRVIQSTMQICKSSRTRKI